MSHQEYSSQKYFPSASLPWPNVFSAARYNVLCIKSLLMPFCSTDAQISLTWEIEEPIAYDIAQQLTLLLTLDW